MLFSATERNTRRFRRKSSARWWPGGGWEMIGEADAKDAEEAERVPT